MKILITLPNLFGNGGVAGHYRTILPRLRDIPSFEVSYLEIGSSHASRGYLHPFADSWNLYRKLRLDNYDLLVVNSSLNPKAFLRDGFFVWLSSRRRVPVLVFFHGWDTAFAKRIEKLWLLFFKTTFLHAGAFIVLASEFSKKLMTWGIEAPVFCETTAVDEELLEKVEVENPRDSVSSSPHLNVLFLARIEREKGIYEAIDASALVRGKGLRLTIAGDGSELKKAQKYAVERLGSMVRFAGFVSGDAKKQEFQNADIYLFPTTHGEGMPISLLEAMAFGLPVVTTPVGGIRDFFEHQKMGFLTDNSDPVALAVLVEVLFADPELRKRISTYNYLYAKEHFWASSVAKRFADICGSVVASK